MDNSEFSRLFTRRLDANDLISVSFVTGDLAEAKDSLEMMKVHGIIYISKNSEADFIQNKSVIIKAILNTSRFLVSNDINKGANETAFQFVEEKRKNAFELSGINSKNVEIITEPVKLDLRAMFNTTETYGDFLIPGLLVLILHQTLMMGFSESIAKERENNSLRDLYKTAGNSSIIAIMGKSTFYFITFSIYAFFVFTVPMYLFNLNLFGDKFALVFSTMLFILSAIFFCMFVSSFFKRKLLALQVLSFSSYPLFLITGYVFPKFAMPSYINEFANLFATTPYFNLFIRLTQMGADWENVKGEITHLLIITVVLAVLAGIRMKWLFYKEVKCNN